MTDCGTVRLRDLPEGSAFRHPASPSRRPDRSEPGRGSKPTLGTGPRTPASSVAAPLGGGATGAEWTQQVLTEPPQTKSPEQRFLDSVERTTDRQNHSPPPETPAPLTEEATPSPRETSPSPVPPTPAPTVAVIPLRSAWRSVCRLAARRKVAKGSRSNSRTSPSPTAIDPEDVDTDAATRYLTHKVNYNQNKLLWNALQSITSVTFMLLTAIVIWLKEPPNSATGLKELEVKTTVNCYCPLDNGRSMTVESTHKEKEPSAEKTDGGAPVKSNGVPMANLDDPQVMHTVFKAYVVGQVIYWGPYALTGLGGLWTAMTLKTLTITS